MDGHPNDAVRRARRTRDLGTPDLATRAERGTHQLVMREGRGSAGDRCRESGTDAARPRAGLRSAALRLALALLLAALPATAWARLPDAPSGAGAGTSGPASSQPGASGPAPGTASGQAPSPGAGAGSVDVVDTGPPPALGAIGVGGGFPSFQTVAPYLSVQAQYVGFQLKASLTPIGPYVGLELRGYPPVGVPVPVFVGVGGGFYGGETAVFGTVGAHVPLSLHVRLDVEAGAANVPLLAGRTWAPYVSLGVSYAFPFTPTQANQDFQVAGPLTIGGGDVPACDTKGQPDKSLLLAAFHRTLQGFLDSARATYGSIYTDLRYHYDVTSVSVSGDTGRVSIHYSGSVRSVATGQRLSASGAAEATYSWTGCGWATQSVHY